jgi:L-alanine-DL-glutamate epimerase-like enolase superfamily enzyme
MLFLRKVDAPNLTFDDPYASMQYVETLGKTAFSAKGSLSTALFDGAARKLKLPLHQFLGLRFREGAHPTSLSIGIDQPSITRERTASATHFSVLKFKVGSAFDRERFAALREVAPEKEVRLDANEAWLRKEQALENICWFATDRRIQFVEQPMPAGTPLSDMIWLKERSPLPIVADESYQSAADVERVALAFDGVNVKICKCGGISQAADALKAARCAGLKTMLGCMIESSVLISAAAHLAELCDYLDLDGNLLIANDPMKVSLRIKGCFPLPEQNKNTESAFRAELERVRLWVTAISDTMALLAHYFGSNPHVVMA